MTAPTEILVLSDDYGIRPAGMSDRCFYCSRKVGEPHDLERCAVIVREVTYGVFLTESLHGKPGTRIGAWRTHDPSFWTKSDCEFHKNQSSWCCDNFLSDGGYQGEDVPDVVAESEDENDCLCGRLYFACESIGDTIIRADRDGRDG